MMEFSIAPASSVQNTIRATSELYPSSLRWSQPKVSANFGSHNGFLKLESTQARRAYASRRCWKKSMMIKAVGNNGENVSWIAPFQPESPTGQYLSQLLKSHPHLLPAAIEQELEKLAENHDKENELETMKLPAGGSDLVLYRRIAEVKEQERRTKLEEIIYTLIVQKFIEAGISMVPSLASITSIEKPWPIQIKELEAVHSVDVRDMIKQHIILVLGSQGTSGYLEHSTYAQISKLRVGQVYAASIIYGYFLRRVYQRFHLEKSMKLLPTGSEAKSTSEAQNAEANSSSPSNYGEGSVLKGFGVQNPMQFAGMKPTALQLYIANMDVELLQRIATVRSRESLRVLEKHTEALFGRPDVIVAPDGSMRVNKDEPLKISFAGLKHLVMESVAFGSFLWDVESHVDASYSFVSN